MKYSTPATIRDAQTRITEAYERGGIEEFMRVADQLQAERDARWEASEARRKTWQPICVLLITAAVMVGMVIVAALIAAALFPAVTAIFGGGVLVGALTFLTVYTLEAVALIIYLVNH